MDTVKSDLNAVDLKAEIEKTTKLIHKLDDAKQSIDRQRNIVSEACHVISNDIWENKDEQIRRWIDRLRIHIVSLQQFPHKPPYYYTMYNTTPSLTTKTEVEEAEKAIRNLKFRFQHNNKNLAIERKIGSELQQCEKKLQEQRDQQQHVDNRRLQETLTNPHYSTHNVRYDGFLYVRVKPLPKESTKRLIMMWADKIQDVSSCIVEDSKRSIPTRKTEVKVAELEGFGMNFYWQVKVGREEFKSLWDDTMKDTKRSIAEVESDMIKVRNRHQRVCLRMGLREKRIELEKSDSELCGQLEIIRKEKFMLKHKLKQMYQLQSHIRL